MPSPMETARQLGSGSSSQLKSQPPLIGSPTVSNPAVAWDGARLRNEDQYAYSFDGDEIAEVEGALQHFKGLGLDGHETARENFPLPTLSPILRALAEELHHGCGFFALRGLDPNKYSREDNIIIFLGISSYVGEMRGKQDDSGHLFAHIRYASYMEETQQERPIRDSNVASAFHTDLFCDIVAMQTRGCAARGGNHIVSSVATIYNELIKTRPDLVAVLAAPNWPFDTRGKLTPPDIRPLLYYHDGHVMMNLVRDPLIGIPSIPRAKGLPCLTPLQVEALDAVQRIAQAHQYSLSMRPGDLTFVNNFGVLHAREAFEDSPAQTRYVVRLWLKNAELAWSLPEELEKGNRRVFGDEGLVEEDWNIVYKPRLKFQLAERMSP